MNRSLRATPPRWARPLAAALLALGCSRAPRLSIDSPVAGSRLSAADDVDPALPGVQIPVVASTSAEEGSVGIAHAGSAQASARVQAGKLRFPSVSVADGRQQLTVTVVDSHGLATAQAQVFADSLAAGCRIVSPANGSVVHADPGDTGIAVVPVAVLCRGADLSKPARLSVDGLLVPAQRLAADGTASFEVELLPGANLLLLDAGGLPQTGARVTLDSPRCRVELAPPTGTRFNLAGAGGAVADREPARAGEQARIVANVACPEGTPARLSASRAGVELLAATAVVHAGAATFDVTLPDGALAVQAFAGAPGAGGASRRVLYDVDSVAPEAQLRLPEAGQVLRDADDASPAPGMQVLFAGFVSGLDSGGTAWLRVDEGPAAGGVDAPLAPAADGKFTAVLSLGNGAHVARVIATRPSGNAVETPSTAFAVAWLGQQLAILSPQPGDVLGLSALVPTPAGARLGFTVRALNLAGGTARVQCGSASGSALVPASGIALVDVDLPFPSCGPASFTCVATASAAGGPTATSAAVSFTADAIAPQVTLLAPPPSLTTKDAAVDLSASTSCPGEAQTFDLRNNNLLLAAGVVSGNAVAFPGLALAPGLNDLVLTVRDAAGNQAVAGSKVTRVVGAPVLALIAPAAGATLAAADDLDHDLTNGLQVPVRVRVDNRPPGTRVDLTVVSDDAGGQPRPALAATTAASGSDLDALFPAVTLPEGHLTLQACVTDALDPPPAPVCVSEQVLVQTGRPVCNLRAPAEGAVLLGSDDARPDLPGFQTDVVVQTGGQGGVTVAITGPDGSVTALGPLAAPAGTGLRVVTFAGATLSGGDGAYRFDATCADGALPGQALSNTAALRVNGPAASFLEPLAGAVFNAASPDTAAAAGFQTRVRVQAAAGSQVTLTVRCDASAAASSGPLGADASGVALFPAITLLPVDGGEDRCTLTAQPAAGLPAQITVRVDRSVPAPAFTAPAEGAFFSPGAPELDCTTPAAPVLKIAALALTDAVAHLDLYVNSALSASAGAAVPGGFQFANLALLAGENHLAVVTVDAAGNRGTAQVSFSARCASTPVALSLLVSGSKLGWAQDRDHSLAGEQIGVQVNAAAPDGTTVVLCSTLADSAGGACESAGAFALPGPVVVLANGSALFQATLPDGAQQLFAELGTHALAPSAPKAVTVRALPPVISALTLQENADGDLALTQPELAATLHFVVAAAGAIEGQLIELHSTSSSAPLGTAVSTATGGVVPVPLSAVSGSGGYQRHVFYALIHDDAGNPASVPGAEYPGEPATTLGTAQQPFVIAPAPTVSLDRPASGTTRLLARDDTRCASSCPGQDPLSALLQGSTNAPDGSTAELLFDGAPLGAALSLSGGAVSFTRLLANGPARALALRVTDVFGNVSTSAARTVLIDSVPPSLALSAPATIATVPAAVTVQTGASLEPGQLITVTSDVDGVVGSAPATGSSTQVSISLVHPGPHQLGATASDAAGNPGQSARVAVLFVYTSPTIALSKPQPSSGTVFFGSSTQSAGRCAPALQAVTSNAPDGSAAALYVVAAADCAGARGAQANAAVSGNQAGFALSFADGAQGFLCAEVTANGTGRSAPQAFACDLQAPQLAFAQPADGQLFVAQPLGSRAPAIANQGQDPGVLVADFALTATAPAGAVVQLFADGAAAPFASQTLAAACSACTVRFPAAQLPIAAGQPLAHALVATVRSPSGNAAQAAQSLLADVAPPGEVQAQATVTHRLAGVVHLAVPSVPGDDGAAGPAPASFQVRWSVSGPLTRANWDTTGVLVGPALLPPPGTPGTAQAFDVVLPADTSALWLGVRASDRVGNLGAFTDQDATTPTVSLTVQRVETQLSGVPNHQGSVAQRMRVADLDGDGYDDVILSYPNDGACASGACDGAIWVYFGGSGGVVNPGAPMQLSGGIAGGQLGFGQSFDTGDFDGDGRADVVAAATDCASAAAVYLWKGSAIAAARASGTTPAPVLLQSGSALLGGSVRAVGHVTGGAAAGDDLLVSAFTPGCGANPDPSLWLLPRGGAWLGGTTSLAAAAQATIALPPGHPFGAADAAAVGAQEGSTTREALFVSFLDTSSPLAELRTLPGSALAGAVALTSGVLLPTPSGGGAEFGRNLGAGLDAVGDARPDLVVSGDKRVFLFDSTTLLKPGAAPATVLDVTGEANADVSYCAGLLPDLDGDGKAEFHGCANLAQAPSLYIAFGGSGPDLSFFGPTPPGFFFSPHRGQRYRRASAFAQKVSAGHVSSKSGIDLVVLSEDLTHAAQLTLLR